MRRTWVLLLLSVAACSKGKTDERIAWVSWRGEAPGVFQAPSRGGTAQRVSDTRVWSASPPLWSADGASIAFTDETSPGVWSIVIAGVPSGERRVLAKGSKLEAWTPDGARMLATNVVDVDDLLEGNKPLKRSLQQIQSIDVATGTKKRVSDGAGWDFSPAISADGSRVAFVSNRKSFVELRTMSIDGSGGKRLVKSKDAISSPSWSPDGTAIVFECARGDGQKICVAPAAGGNPAELTAMAWAADPRYSPDGRRIAFVAKDAEGVAQLHVMDFDGRNVRALTTGGKTASPAWSSDGTRIAVARDDGKGNVDVIVLRSSDGGGETNVSRDPARDTYPSWQPLRRGARTGT